MLLAERREATHGRLMLTAPERGRSVPEDSLLLLPPSAHGREGFARVAVATSTATTGLSLSERLVRLMLVVVRVLVLTAFSGVRKSITASRSAVVPSTVAVVELIVERGMPNRWDVCRSGLGTLDPALVRLLLRERVRVRNERELLTWPSTTSSTAQDGASEEAWGRSAVKRDGGGRVARRGGACGWIGRGRMEPRGRV